MTLTAGAKIGPYEILSPLGAGGMGEVFRARDTRLNRDVAIKILPDLFAADPDRLARVKREAQVLASLNHPNIAAIYGLEEQAAVQALVLELVEGPTLADRIAQGPIPLDEALPVARQIAEALVRRLGRRSALLGQHRDRGGWWRLCCRRPIRRRPIANHSADQLGVDSEVALRAPTPSPRCLRDLSLGPLRVCCG